MTKKEFIEKAIGGGWKHQGPVFWNVGEIEQFYGDVLFLDPLAWQAVGKVEGWKSWSNKDGWLDDWQYHMHRMIDALCDDKTLEEFLATL